MKDNIDMDRLIIDTDIGSDIDDALAIAFAIKSGIQIPLITTVHGDTQKRARIAKKLIDLLEADIPIVAGESSPIKQKQIFWYGHEGIGLIEDSELRDIKIGSNAAEAIAEKVYENSNKISIAAIGPLTNIARAFEKYPNLPSKINKIYLMGSIAIRSNELIQTYRSHNFKVDPEAYDIVYNTLTEKIIVTTEIGKSSYLSKGDLSEMEKESSSAGVAWLASGARIWLEHSMYDVAYLYDPITVAHHNHPTLTERLRAGNTQVTRTLKEDFKKLLLETISGKL